MTSTVAAPRETGSIRGAVTTVGPDGVPVCLPGVEIVLRCEGFAPNSRSTLADETGRFSLQDLAPQKCSITALEKGFHSETKSVAVVGEGRVDVFFRLKLMTAEEQGTVSGEVPAVDITEASQRQEIQSRAKKRKDLNVSVTRNRAHPRSGFWSATSQ